jgi:hypothetical protein
MDWLVRDLYFFGVNGQVWMPLLASALVLYIAALLLVRHRTGSY